MALKIYDADQVAISIAGIPITGGYADGEFCRIERETDAFVDVVGTDGEVTRSKSGDDRATVTILLMQTAESNALLAALHNADKLAANGAGVGPLLIKDLNSDTTLHSSPECWVQSSPSVSYGREAGAREWPIRVSKLIDFVGGN